MKKQYSDCLIANAFLFVSIYQIVFDPSDLITILFYFSIKQFVQEMISEQFVEK